MFAYIWPVLLVVASNTIYHICAKSSPEAMDPFAALSVTYLVGAAASLLCYFLLNRGGNLMREFSQLNWAPAALGLSVLGLEVGVIYGYRVGWPVSLLSTVQSAFLAICLLAVGTLVYGEQLSWSRVSGVVICLVGLAVMNR